MNGLTILIMKRGLDTKMKQQIIAQAAEAIIIREGNKKVIKRRIKKGYRIPELDEKLRKLRTRGEARLLEKASNLVSVPKVLKSDEKTKEIELEFIEGDKLSEKLSNYKEKKQQEIMKQVGQETSCLHDNNMIHGDLTTSNMILVENHINNKNKLNKQQEREDKLTIINNYNKTAKELVGINKDTINLKNNESELINAKLTKQINNLSSNIALINDKSTNKNNSENLQVYIIDFGLGYISSRIEDKAVDIHLLKQALEAKHFLNWEKLFHAFLQGYKSKDKAKILEQLKKVEARGRYKKG